MEEKLRPRIQKKRKDQNTHMGKNAKQETKFPGKHKWGDGTPISVVYITLFACMAC